MGKKLFTILFVITLFITKVSGQTTLEEYNYITKGYKIQLESGLDMKKGYEIQNLDEKSTNERKAELKVLFRIKNGSKEIAAYIVIYKRGTLPTEYICIPNPNSNAEILTKYWTQLYDGGTFASERLQLITYLISKQMKW